MPQFDVLATKPKKDSAKDIMYVLTHMYVQVH